MPPWLRRLRGMIGTGLTWAVAWALFGLGVGVASVLLPWLPWAPIFEVFDAPLPALAVPGFVAGMLFSLVLGAAARARQLRELSVRQFAIWGALGGLLLSLIPATLSMLGLATIAPSALGLWGLTAVVGVPFVLLSAASAAGSLVLARRAEDRGLLAARVGRP